MDAAHELPIYDRSLRYPTGDNSFRSKSKGSMGASVASCEVSNAKEFREHIRKTEPSLGCKTTLDYLQEFKPTSEGATVAKVYWLSKNASFPINGERYREEIMELGKIMWRWHVRLVANCELSYGYNGVPKEHPKGIRGLDDYMFCDAPQNRTTNLIESWGETHAQIYSEQPVRPTSGLWEGSEPLIPDTFQTYRDYAQLEPDDVEEVHQQLEGFPIAELPGEKQAGIKGALLYWSMEHGAESERAIAKMNYPKEVETFRLMLWKRHLGLQQCENMIDNEIEADRAEQLKVTEGNWRIANLFLGVAGVVSGLAAAIFFLVAIVSSGVVSASLGGVFALISLIGFGIRQITNSNRGLECNSI